MHINRLLLLTLLVPGIACQAVYEPTNPPAGSDLLAHFQQPPVDARPRGLWTWINGNYDSLEIWREMRAAKAMGMGGFDIWDAPTVRDPKGVVPIGPDQVSDTFMWGVGIAAEAARETGLELGYIWNQSVSYLAPEHSHMALFLSTQDIAGAGLRRIELPFPEVPPHKRFGYQVLQRDERGRPLHWGNVAVLAYPLDTSDPGRISLDRLLDLTGQLSGDRLEWDVPPGRWRILRFVWSRTSEVGLTPTPATVKPALDFLNPEATEQHLTYLLDLMEKQVGPLRDSPIKYLCADSYEFKGLWTPALPQLFRERLGYELRRFLPALEGYTLEDATTTARFLYDFHNLRSDLVIQNHYAKAKEVCNRYGIGFTAEAAGPGPPTHMDVPMESIQSSGALSFPRGEFWINDNNPSREHLQIIKGIASAAHLYGQPYVTAEAFTGVHLWAFGPGDLKPYADRAFAEGLNRIDFHTFPHTPPSAGLPGWIYSFGNIISENLIWWPKAKGFMEYLGRSSYLLQQGQFVGDALYYHGSSAPFFAKPKHIKPELGLGYEYDVCNEDILMNRLAVQEGKLMLPHGQRYSVLVLPEKDWMPLHVLKRVEELVRAGATVIGPKPTRSNGLATPEEDAQVKALADQLWEGLDGIQQTEKRLGKGWLCWGGSPREVLLSHGIEPDLSFSTARQDTLDFIHRRLDGIDIYFLRNPYDKPITALASFRVARKRPERWDLTTGSIRLLSVYQSSEGRTLLPLSFAPHDSYAIVFRNERPAQATVRHKGQPVFPAAEPPAQWPFEDLGAGELAFTSGGSFSIKLDAQQQLDAAVPRQLKMAPAQWTITFRDPWGEVFSIETATLQSWTAFEEHRIQYFSGSGTYETDFELPAAMLGRRLMLELGRVEEVAEVWINGQSVGLVWEPQATLDVSQWVQAGTNTLKVEVLNRWPNRMIGDQKLPEAERRVRSTIVTLPSAWHAPLAQLPSEAYPLQPSGLLGPVRMVAFETVAFPQPGDD